MLKLLLPAALLAFSTVAHAADMTAPARAIMNVAVARWADTDSGPLDYFDDAHIGNFSSRVRALYAEASKHPAYDAEEETGNPFDYDPIISGQDGCALEELTFEDGPKTETATEVIARFKRFTCFEGSSPEERNAVSQVGFRVISENGRPVIDDVITGEGDERYSLVEELKTIIGR